MTDRLLGVLYDYFETLRKLNENLIQCCQTDISSIAGMSKFEDLLRKIIEVIPRMVPYGKPKGKEEYCMCDRDGLLEFSEELPFLREDYEEILEKHKDFLINIKRIRNKLEHRMQAVMLPFSMSNGNGHFEITYKIDEEKENKEENELTFTSSDFMTFMEQLDILHNSVKRCVEFASSGVTVSDQRCALFG